MSTISKFIFLFLISLTQNCFADHTLPVTISTKQEAFEYLDKTDQTKESTKWPNIKPKLFYDNLKLNLDHPMSFYPGRSTNFCSYGALSFIIIEKDPLGYVKFMNELYEKGHATYNGNRFNPSKPILAAAGTLMFKGVLDIRHAEQMWFLVLADKFKGYLNTLNRHYNAGDENTFWAATNLAKFNRMVRKMCKLPVRSVGSDLLRPWIKDPYEYLVKRLDSNMISLYINNRVVHKSNHDKIVFSIPTHFIILRQLRRENDMITIRYWDYGGETEMQMKKKTFKKIIFGMITVGK